MPATQRSKGSCCLPHLLERNSQVAMCLRVVGLQGDGLLEGGSGLGQTALLAELAFDPDQPLPGLPSLFKGGFRAAMADGSVRWVQKGTSAATLRAAITRNGGDRLGPDW
jgi:hypothetical protein